MSVLLLDQHEWVKKNEKFTKNTGKIYLWRCQLCREEVWDTLPTTERACTYYANGLKPRKLTKAEKRKYPLGRNDQQRAKIDSVRSKFIDDVSLGVLKESFAFKYVVTLLIMGTLTAMFGSNLVFDTLLVVLVIMGTWKAFFRFIDSGGTTASADFLDMLKATGAAIGVFVFSLGILLNGAVTIPLTLMGIAGLVMGRFAYLKVKGEW